MQEKHLMVFIFPFDLNAGQIRATESTHQHDETVCDNTGTNIRMNGPELTLPHENLEHDRYRFPSL